MAGQLLPKNSQWLMDIYSDATERPYGYLVIDNSPQSDHVFRFRTNIFRGELPTVYCDRKTVYKWPRSRSPNKLLYQANEQIKIEKFRRELTKVKHIIKFLSHLPESKITRAILASSPEGVIRAVSNAALNLQRNCFVKLDPATRNLFETYSRSFDILTDRKIPIEQKRKHLTQQGGAIPILGPLLSTALILLESGFISRIFNREESNE